MLVPLIFLLPFSTYISFLAIFIIANCRQDLGKRHFLSLISIAVKNFN